MAASKLPCHDCGKPKCRCDFPSLWTRRPKKFLNDLRALQQRMYFNGHKYDSLASAEETKFLLDIIAGQDALLKYSERQMKGQ